MAFPIYFPKRRSERGDTAAVLASANEILLNKEWCVETDTGRWKRGDGVTAYNALPYAVAGDIDLTGLADGDALVWDSGAGQWVPVQPGDVAGDTHAATSKATPVDADELPLADSAASFALKKLTWANLKAGVIAALHANLTALAGLTGAADKLAYFTGAGAMALTSLTSFARSLLAATSAANARTILGVTSGGAIGASGQAYSRWDFVDHGVALSTNTGTNFLTNASVPVVYQNTVASGVLIAGEQLHPGICRIGTGSSVSGYSRMFFTPGLMLYLGGGEVWLPVCLRIPTLSTATQRFAVTFGLYNAITGPSRILDLTYSDNANSGLWQLRGIDAGGTTTANAATGPAANTFTQGLGLLINAAASSVSLVDAGVTVATINANIPSADALGLALEINKSVGSTERTVDVDLAEYQNTFTTAR